MADYRVAVQTLLNIPDHYAAQMMDPKGRWITMRVFANTEDAKREIERLMQWDPDGRHV